MISDILRVFGDNIHNKGYKTSGVIFKLLTRITVNILIVSCFIISLKQYFGEPIACNTDIEGSKKSIVETKCWIEGVYLEKRLMNATLGAQITRYGVGSRQKSFVADDYIVQTYYQWIVPILALQALLLYFPRVLWKGLENGLIGKLINEANSLILDDKWKEQKFHILKFFKQNPKKYFTVYFIKYVICEVLSFISLVVSMYIMQVVFNQFWTEFQPAIAALLNGNINAFYMHSAKLFPTQAKCLYNSFGPSGSMEVRDLLCFLPQNAINEKIFVFLYFWLIAMFILGLFMLAKRIYSIVTKFCKMFQPRRFNYEEDSFSKRHEAQSIKMMDPRVKDFFETYNDFGYCFILFLLEKNLSPLLFKDLVVDLMKGVDLEVEMKIVEILNNQEVHQECQTTRSIEVQEPRQEVKQNSQQRQEKSSEMLESYA